MATPPMQSLLKRVRGSSSEHFHKFQTDHLPAIFAERHPLDNGINAADLLCLRMAVDLYRKRQLNENHLADLHHRFQDDRNTADADVDVLDGFAPLAIIAATDDRGRQREFQPRMLAGILRR